MGEGLKRAILATVLSRAPWAIEPGTGTGQVRSLTADELRAFYEAVPQGPAAMLAVLDVTKATDRKYDRAVQLLRKVKLIKFDTATRTWHHV